MTEGAIREAYPFPEDELLYWTGSGFTDPGKHSYVAVARLPDWHRLEVNGAVHNNSHRLVIHTPIRGPVSFLTRPRDMEGFVLNALRLTAESGITFGPEDEIHLYESWLESNLGGTIVWHPKDGGEEYVIADEKAEAGDDEVDR